MDSVLSGYWGKSEFVGGCNHCHKEGDIFQIEMERLVFRLCRECVTNLRILLEQADEMPLMVIKDVR